MPICRVETYLNDRYSNLGLLLVLHAKSSCLANDCMIIRLLFRFQDAAPHIRGCLRLVYRTSRLHMFVDRTELRHLGVGI